MNQIEIISIIFSIIGASIFLIALQFESKIIKLLSKYKKANNWIIATILTAFFFFGYIINIISIVFGLTELQAIMNAFVYLFGAIFLVLVIIIAYRTYNVIFEEAERQINSDLSLK